MNANREAVIRKKKKAIVAVTIIIPVALLHFVTGPSYSGPFPDFVNGYLIDILLPFALYFLLASQDPVWRFFKPWWTKGVAVFSIGLITEVLQYYGVPLFGQTYDPLDFAAYGLGVAIAVVIDRLLFRRIFNFWE